MKQGHRKKILYLVQLPPPVHGVSMTNRYVTESDHINAGFDHRILRIRFSASVSGLRRFSLMHIPRYLNLICTLFLQLLSWRPDIVYFSLIPVGIGFLRDLSLLVIVKVTGATPVLHLNNRGIALRSHSRIYRALYRFAFRNCHVIHQTPWLAGTELSWLDLKQTRVHIVPNTVQPSFPVSGRTNSGASKLVFFSNLFPGKGLMVLLSAFARLKQQYPGLELHVYGAGRGKEDEQYHRFIEKNDLEDIRFHGPVSREGKREVFMDHDIFVFPSHFTEECFPLVLLEAMACGIPIVATTAGGIPEMLTYGEHAILVNEKDPSGLAGGIEKLILDPALRTFLGKNAMQKFHEQYRFDIFEDRIREVFEMASGNEQWW